MTMQQDTLREIAIYTLTSTLHDAKAVNATTREFLSGLGIDFDFRDNDYQDYGSRPLSLIFVRTGGTEGIFRQLLPQLQRQSREPIYLLTSGKSNSLAASMEILSFMRQNGIRGEILHGSNEYIRRRTALLLRVEKARRRLRGSRLGVAGKPSDWLISSIYDREAVLNKLGMDIIDIPMSELLSIYNKEKDGRDEVLESMAPTESIRHSLPGALRIYASLREIIGRHNLQGLTIRCFDLLTAVRNTGCIALAKLNAEGTVAGCEGDVPAMLSMMASLALTGKTGFQANPASIDVENGRLLFAHCTIPLNMVSRYELDTHYESGIGVGIRGYLEGPVTVFKMSGTADRYFAAEGEIISCGDKPDLCRTQLTIQLDAPAKARYFLTNPIGNHHIIIPGRHADALRELLGMTAEK